MISSARGFTLMELLITLLLMSVVLGVAAGVFVSQRRLYSRQDVTVAMEENLRIGMDLVVDTLRAGGYGVPKTSVAGWIPWVPGFTTNPTITGTSPATVAVAGCFLRPVASLAVPAVAGASVLTLTSAVAGKQLAEVLDSGTQRLIMVGDSENAHVLAVSGSLASIDTNAVGVGAQGLARPYPVGTPIRRIDVLTFSIVTDAATGIPHLRLDGNQGAAAVPAVEGINNLQVTTVAAGKQYRVTLSAISETVDPLTGAYVTRTMSSNVTLKN